MSPARICAASLTALVLLRLAYAWAIAPDVRAAAGFAAVALQANDAMPDARLLSKPFHLKDLVAQVDAIFGRHGQMGSA